jgi:hypothetical protein
VGTVRLARVLGLTGAGADGRSEYLGLYGVDQVAISYAVGETFRVEGCVSCIHEAVVAS